MAERVRREREPLVRRAPRQHRQPRRSRRDADARHAPLDADRHPGNLLVVPDPDEAHVRVVAIDSGNARVGFPSDYVAAPADAIPDVAKQVDLPIAAFRDGAMVAAALAEGLDGALVREIVAEACELVREPAVDALAAALDARCRRATDLTSRYLQALEARR